MTISKARTSSTRYSLLVFLTLFLLAVVETLAAPLPEDIEGCESSPLTEEFSIAGEMEESTLPEKFSSPFEGTYRWQSVRIHSEKIGADGSVVARFGFREWRQNQGDKTEIKSEVLCTRGLAEKSSLQDWRVYLPSISEVRLKEGRLKDYRLRRHLLTVERDIQVSGDRLIAPARTSLRAYFKVSDVRWRVVSSPSSPQSFHVHLQKVSEDGTTTQALVTLTKTSESSPLSLVAGFLNH